MFATSSTATSRDPASEKVRSGSSKKGNKNLKPTLKPFWNVLLKEEGKISEINWLGDEDSNLD